ncbi:hypothetical protein GGR56DRAFT_612422 [Xylariaceae sp. FL0804]|nr:hypothetical protein GGR56DRAFT_612422 [Xylariaceae sp. FL0804]
MSDPSERVEKGVMSSIDAWGNSSMSPLALATLIAPLHARPLRVGPLLFVPALLFASYANLQGFRVDAAGLTAAASGTYALLALRRRPSSGRLGVRGAVRGTALTVAAANVVAGAWVYARGDRARERREREENPRWVE